MKESLHALLILCFLIPLIVVVIYLLKKMIITPNKDNQNIKVINQISIGAKERVLCLEVNGTTILIGATAHTISTLHIFKPE